MAYSGWNDYMRAAGLYGRMSPAAAQAFKMQEQEFNVARAAVPYTNTPARASSTFVTNIRYLPSSNTAFVRLGNSTYWYPMTQRQMANWLTSNSLGRYYNNYVKLR